MGKVLLWVVVVLVVLMVARIAARNSAARQARNAAPKTAHASKPAPRVEAMVRCAHCGIHLPRSEALLVNGQTWCGQEHARLGTGPT